jgi:hypothetical protein
MLKMLTAIMTAAAIAAVVTVISAPGPLAQPNEAVLKVCTQKAWPYLNCVGTTVGNPRIRLVTTDRIAQ